MLTLTDDAQVAIRSLVEPSDSATSAGVRIASEVKGNGAGPELAMSVVGEPAPGDQVVDEAGARVFLDETAAQMLEDETLDVQIDSTAQQVNFFVR